MRSMLKGSGALVAMLLLVASTAASAYNKIEKPLYAGQHILVGKLIVEQYKVNTKKYLRVTYDTTSSNWGMTTTHLYVSKNKPTRAAPGRFPFKHEGLDNVKIDVYEIPLSQLLCSTEYLYIAAHADVCEVYSATPCVPDFAAYVAAAPPSPSTVTVDHNKVTATFNVTTVSGTFLGWCFDAFGPIRDRWDDGNAATSSDQYDGALVEYTSDFVPSLLPDGSTNPDGLPLLGSSAATFSGTPLNVLNYLMNQPYVAACGNGGPYSARDIQVAIWHITNGVNYAAFSGVNIANVEAILADVTNVANGASSFVPGCGQVALVLIDPQTPVLFAGYHNQHMGIVLPLDGQTETQCETAWAKGTTSFCTGWGSYFKYTVK